MGLINRIKKKAVVCFSAAVLCVLTACTISYKFNGSSINYDKVKTISFDNFPNRSAAFVWGPMESMFNTALQDKYMQQTRLRQVRQNGDLTVNVRFVNNSNHAEDITDQQFSASREYNSSQQLSSVQEELVTQMIDEIVEQIFNATVANW